MRASAAIAGAARRSVRGNAAVIAVAAVAGAAAVIVGALTIAVRVPMVLARRAAVRASRLNLA